MSKGRLPEIFQGKDITSIIFQKPGQQMPLSELKTSDNLKGECVILSEEAENQKKKSKKVVETCVCVLSMLKSATASGLSL